MLGYADMLLAMMHCWPKPTTAKAKITKPELVHAASSKRSVLYASCGRQKECIQLSNGIWDCAVPQSQCGALAGEGGGGCPGIDGMQCREVEGQALGVNHDGRGCVCCRNSVLALTCTEQQERVH